MVPAVFSFFPLLSSPPFSSVPSRFPPHSLSPFLLCKFSAHSVCDCRYFVISIPCCAASALSYPQDNAQFCPSPPFHQLTIIQHHARHQPFHLDYFSDSFGLSIHLIDLFCIGQSSSAKLFITGKAYHLLQRV